MFSNHLSIKTFDADMFENYKCQGNHSPSTFLDLMSDEEVDEFGRTRVKSKLY